MSAAHPLREKWFASEATIGAVTRRLTCSDCRRPLGPEEPAYRLLVGGWDHTTCEACSERQRGLVPGYQGLTWRGPIKKHACEYCGGVCYVRAGAYEPAGSILLPKAERRWIFRAATPPLYTRFCSKSCQQRYLRQLKQPSVACGCCGITFQPTRADQQHCSNACRQRAYRLRKGKA